MKQIIEKNYDSIIKRGLITPDTSVNEFLDKLHEECTELGHDCANGVDFAEELSDVILVCLNMAKHFDIDIEKELNKKIQKNYDR